jgi:hydroxymethylbilane synthase
LARRQTESVVEALRNACPDCRLEVRVVRTTGDKRPQPLSEISGEGVFTKELETSLLDGEIDIAVHSLKDLPTQIAGGLTIAAIPRREDPRDALVSTGNMPLARLPLAARVGTGSVRRSSQLLLLRPDLQPVAIRGNVDTRLKKLEANEVDAIIVAAAALSRLGWLVRASELISLEAMLPQPGQGALAIETRADDEEALRIVNTVDDVESRQAVEAERAFLKRLGGGCRIPVGALATITDGEMRLDGVVVDGNGCHAFRGEMYGSPEKAESLGKDLAESLLGDGASKILEGKTL